MREYIGLVVSVTLRSVHERYEKIISPVLLSMKSMIYLIGGQNDDSIHMRVNSHLVNPTSSPINRKQIQRTRRCRTSYKFLKVGFKSWASPSSVHGPSC